MLNRFKVQKNFLRNSKEFLPNTVKYKNNSIVNIGEIFTTESHIIMKRNRKQKKQHFFLTTEMNSEMN